MLQCTPCKFNAPLAMLVCYDTTIDGTNFYDRGDQRRYGAVDASIVLTHMMLKAAYIALGTVWIGLFNPQLLREYFNIPEHYEILSLMYFGYPDANVKPDPRHNDIVPI